MFVRRQVYPLDNGRALVRFRDPDWRPKVKSESRTRATFQSGSRVLKTKYPKWCEGSAGFGSSALGPDHIVQSGCSTDTGVNPWLASPGAIFAIAPPPLT